MKIIHIKRLEITNFKGIQGLVIAPDTKKNVYLYGDNEAGKTSVTDAFLWLLYDKNAENESNFGIKPKDKKHSKIDERYPKVSMNVKVYEPGKDKAEFITITKEFAEKWKRPSGGMDYVFDGNTNNYWINGTELKEGEFYARIEELFTDENKLRMISDPFYFAEKIDWQERRKIFMELIETPDIRTILSKLEMVKSSDIDSLADLMDNDLEKFIKSKERRMREIDRELDNINYHFEVSNIEQVSKKDIKDLEDKIADKKKELQEIMEKKANATTNNQKIKIESEISEIENKMDKMKRSHINKVNQKIDELADRKRDLQMKAGNKQQKLNEGRAEVKRLKEEKQRLIKEYKEADNKDIGNCPYCNQELPEDEQEDAAEEKSNRLKEIKKDGKATVRRIKSLEEEILPEYAKDLKELSDELSEVEKEIEAEKSSKNDFVTLEYTELNNRKKKLETKLLNLDEDTSTEDFEEKIRTLNKEIDELQNKKAEMNSKLIKLEEFEEVQGKEEKLQKEYKELQRLVIIGQKAMEKKLEVLEERASNLLDDKITVKLFDYNQSGGYKETCKIYYDGVEFAKDLNNGHKIRVGGKIINILSRVFGMAMPVFIDNAEAVTEKIDTIGQRFYLAVLKEDKVKKMADKKGLKIANATGRTPIAIEYEEAN